MSYCSWCFASTGGTHCASQDAFVNLPTAHCLNSSRLHHPYCQICVRTVQLATMSLCTAANSGLREFICIAFPYCIVHTGWNLASHGKVKWLCAGMTSIGRFPCLKGALSQAVFQTSLCLGMKNKTDSARCQCCRLDEILGGVSAPCQQFSILISHNT